MLYVRAFDKRTEHFVIVAAITDTRRGSRVDWHSADAIGSKESAVARAGGACRA